MTPPNVFSAGESCGGELVGLVSRQVREVPRSTPRKPKSHEMLLGDLGGTWCTWRESFSLPLSRLEALVPSRLKGGLTLPEHQSGEFAQVPAPRLPFVRRAGRFEEDVLHARFVQSFMHRLRALVHGLFSRTGANPQEADLLVESCRVAEHSVVRGLH